VRVLLLVLAAVAMGLSNFAGAIAIGASGVDNRTRIRVAAVFGLFEAGMPLVGLAVGHGVEGDVGGAARWLAAGLLVAIGAHQIVQAVREASAGGSPDVSSATQLRRLWVTGFALSIDNLAIGFVLGTYDVNVVIAIAVIAVVSVGMSLAGLELGARIGTRIGGRGAMLGGILLASVGVAIAFGAF
jgi:manganese efflux pump family protein